MCLFPLLEKLVFSKSIWNMLGFFNLFPLLSHFLLTFEKEGELEGIWKEKKNKRLNPSLTQK